MQTSKCRMAGAAVGREEPERRDPLTSFRAAQRRFAVTGLQLAVKGKASNGLCEKRGRCRTEARSGGWGKGRTRGCSLAKSGREGEDWARGRGSGWAGGWAEGKSRCRAGPWGSGMRKGRGGTKGRGWGEDWSWGWSEDRSSSKARARSRLCSCARGDAKARGCSGVKGSPNHTGSSHRKRRWSDK